MDNSQGKLSYLQTTRKYKKTANYFDRYYDTVAIVVIVLGAMYVFGYESNKLGFYGDDSGFMIYAGKLSFFKVLKLASQYLPGRNLHIVWQYGLYYFLGGDIDSLYSLHIAQAIASTIVIVTLYLTLRTVTCSTSAALSGSAIFAFYPNHTEVQFWPSALPMNIFSTELVLVLLLCLVFVAKYHEKISIKYSYTLIFVAGLSGSLAMFTYDQPVPAVMLIISAIGLFIILQSKRMKAAIVALWISTSVVFFANIFAKLIDAGNGPGFGSHDANHIVANIKESISNSLGSSLYNNVTDFSLNPISSGTLCSAFVIFSSIMICCIFFLDLEDFDQDLPDLSEFKIMFIVLIFRIIFYIASYLPNYLWFLATRHNYLPSIGIAIAFSAFADIMMDIISYSPWRLLSRMFAWVLYTAISLFIFLSISSIIVSKSLWIESFQLRKGVF